MNEGNLSKIITVSTNMAEIYYRIDSHRFHFLKFILEGYDNLAMISSVPGDYGLVRIRCSSEMLGELFGLMTKLAPTIKRSRLK